MKRILILLVATAVCLLGQPLMTPAHAATGTFREYTNLGLPYWVYQPSSYTGSSQVPLVVYLHGCQQTAPDAAVGTRWNTEAEAEGFIAVYPQQLAGLSGPLTPGNANACWNFYDPVAIGSRTAGEPAQIAAITRKVIADWNVDPKRVYIAGASGGGGMSNVMGVLFPDLYAAVAVIAGCAYSACTDASGTIAWGTLQRLGVTPRQIPAFVAGAVTDPVTNYALTATTVTQYNGLHDYADDGLLNGTVAHQPGSTTNIGFDQTPQPGSGELCMPSSYTTPIRRVPCPGGLIGFQDTYPYSVQKYFGAPGEIRVEAWSIYGPSHSYVGGDMAGSFTDPLGPNITHGAWEFFENHPMP